MAREKTVDIMFERQNPEKEEAIRQRCGWFLEYKTSGLFYYPPEGLSKANEALRLTLRHKVTDWIDSTEDPSVYLTLHVWESSGDVARKTYYTNFRLRTGEAEYLGRKAGMDPGETESLILESIGAQVKERCRSARVAEGRTEEGKYRVFFRHMTAYDRKVLATIRAELAEKYPNDVFAFMELKEVAIP